MELPFAASGPFGPPDAVDLASRLVQTGTAGRDEDLGLRIIAPLLAEAGLVVQILPWREGRPNLIARWKDGGDLVLSGQMDTVPASAEGWSSDPLAGVIRDGRLQGRGAADMKGGLAAMVAAAVEAAAADSPPFTLVVTSAEETGCQGATALGALGLLPANPVLIVGEATGNRVLFGHKGATWLAIRALGKAAHGSRPELGANAILHLAQAIVALQALEPSSHPRLGQSTVSAGTIEGGTQTNLVPDRACMTVDVRTVSAADTGRVIEVIERTAGAGSVETILDLPSIWTDPSSPLSQRAGEIVQSLTGSPAADTAAPYFTDAAVLAQRTAPRVYIIGPGALDAPHTSDEGCQVEAIRLSQRIYLRLLKHLTN
jgi:succinyl-diaminopimelate desuccinylase